MPVIVVGADTPLGTVIVDHLVAPDREIRAFVTDPAAGSELRRRGVKVAVGDLSDSSHVEGACLACYSAVLVMDATTDGRELAFASASESVLEGWAGAVRSSVRRVLWVGDADPPATGVAETAVVRVAGRDPAEVAREVAALDDAAEL
jgi:putative NADH-flavin reductase